jgi:hypothetical protein
MADRLAVDVAEDVLLSHELDDLLLQARGLVLVRRVLEERGASDAELEAHSSELERVRRRLAGRHCDELA